MNERRASGGGALSIAGTHKRHGDQSIDTFMRAWAALDPIHIHDLRHSVASELINAGVDLNTVGKVSSHQDARSTQRYAHLAVTTLSAAIGKIRRMA